jgi:GTPase SAR1 family protein
MAVDINITMLGPSRVGKTSLLSSLYYQIPDVIQDTNLSLKPEIETAVQLDECLEKLKNLANDRELNLNDGIDGDDVKKSYYFSLGLAGHKPAARLHFQDYPGGWIQNIKNSNSDDLKQVKQFIRDSHAILIPIDTPAIFERNEEDCNKINQIPTVCHLIEEIFNDCLHDDSLPRLIILVPLKCEKYMKNTEYKSQISNQIKQRYKKLFTYVSQPNLSDKIAVVLTPVQTTGNVIFYYIAILFDFLRKMILMNLGKIKFRAVIKQLKQLFDSPKRFAQIPVFSQEVFPL